MAESEKVTNRRAPKLRVPTTYVNIEIWAFSKVHFSPSSWKIGGAQNITLSGLGLGMGGGRNFFFPQSANWGGPVGHLAWESKFFTHPWAGSWVKRSPGPKSGIMGSSQKRAPHGSPHGCRNPPNAFLPWNQLCWRQPDYKNAICRK